MIEIFTNKKYANKFYKDLFKTFGYNKSFEKFQYNKNLYIVCSDDSDNIHIKLAIKSYLENKAHSRELLTS